MVTNKGKTAFCLLAVFLLLPYTIDAQSAVFYVSSGGSDSNPGNLAQPFKTIEKARDVVRTLNSNMQDDIIVYLKGGTYQLQNTLTFDQRDSGTNGFRVIYQAAGDGLPIISGGQQITGWTSVGGGIYAAQAGGLRFRQLYVNGERALRARQPNTGSFYNVILWVGPNWDAGSANVNRLIQVNAGEIANWNRLNEVEMVIHKEWVQNILRIQSFSVSGSVASVTLRDPDVRKGFGSHCWLREPNDQSCLGCCVGVHDAYFYENAYEFLDQAGEWYLNTGTNTVYYKPRTGEDMTTAVVMVPRLERLVGIEGTASSPVHDLEFRGVAFAYSTWLAPSDEGFATGQADVIDETGGPYNRIPAAVYLRYAQNVVFREDIFRNLGGMGLKLFSGTRNNQVLANVFHTIAGGAIAVDHALNANPASSELSQGDRIEDNYVTRIGLDYHSSVGIFGGYTDSMLVAHNELEDLPYTGISTGWGWTANLTALRNNIISDNLVHNVMNQLADGAGIYTLSNQPGSQLLRNRIYGIHRTAGAGQAPIAGIYLDEQTTGFLVEGNEIFDVDKAWNFNNIGSNTIGTNTGPTPNAGIEPAYQWIKDPSRWGGSASPTLPLVGHWKFDETSGTTASDSSGNGNTGTLVNGPTWATGKLNNSLSFDGADDYVNINTALGNFGTENFTVGFWYKSSSKSQQYIISKRTVCGHTSFWNIGIDNTGVLFWELDQDASGTNYNSGNPTKDITDNQWHHIAIVRSGATIYAYIDGSLDTTDPGPGTASLSNSANLQIGQSPCAGNLAGSLDDVRIYNRAVNASEIQALYQAQTPYCGDISCNNGETCSTCPQDCGSCSGWTFCANENELCSFTGTKEVQYGANGMYAYGNYTNGVQCNNSVFGDPIQGVEKQCYYRDAGTACIHESDSSCDGCVSMSELTAFIDRWKINNQDVTLKELIEAIGLWKRGC